MFQHYIISNFFVKSLISGIGIVLAASPLGCIMLWKRMAYLSDSLSHAALLGIALGLLLGITPFWSALSIAIVFSILLIFLNKQLSNDTVLSIFAFGSLALALMITSLFSKQRLDLDSFLFGDILIISNQDMLYIALLLIIFIIWAIFRWRALLSTIICRDLASVTGISVNHVEIELMIALSFFIAISFQIIGILLITAILIIPAATARYLSSTPEQMVIISAIIGTISMVLGLLCSLIFDTPGSASIVTMALSSFIIVNIIHFIKGKICTKF